MKRIIFFSILTFLSFQNFLKAQETSSLNISGKVTDEVGNPLDFCTATLVKATDSNLVRSSLTNSEGLFLFGKLNRGSYKLVLTSIGYLKHVIGAFDLTTDLKMNTIILKPDNKALKEVVVVAKKPLYEQHLDKLVINVQNSITSVGSNASELLEQAPGVSLTNGNISLKGKSGISVLIDGRPTYLSSEELAERLKTMNSNLIEKIEIVENPSSKYDAAGSGIINMVTKKNENFGLNGSVGSGISMGRFAKNNNNLNLNYRIGKLNIYGNYSYVRNLNGVETHLQRVTEAMGLDAQGYRKSKINNHSLLVGADYFIKKNQVVGLMIKGFADRSKTRYNNFTSINNSIGVMDSSSRLSRDGSRSWNNFAVNLNYKITFKKPEEELSVDIDRSVFSGRTRNDILTIFNYSNQGAQSPFISWNSMPSEISVYSVKTDYSYPASKTSRLDFGAKYSYVSTDNDALFNIYRSNEWKVDEGKTNHFIYGENISAAYFTFKQTFGKFEFQTGIRGEQTISKGNSVTLNNVVDRKYFKLFPTAFFSTRLSPSHKINISYSNRVGRPSYNQLNPFTYFVDNYNYFYGNPYLKPTYTNSITFNHIYKDSFFASFNYSFTKDYISYAYYMETQPDSSKVWIETMGNMRKHVNYSLNFTIPQKIANWWNTDNNLLFFYNKDETIYKGVDVNNSRITFKVNSTHSISLPNSYKAEVTGLYSSASVYGFWLVLPRTSINIGVKKAFFKNNMTCTFNVTDIFNTSRIGSKMTYNNIDIQDYTKNETRLVKLNLNYKFGNSKIKAVRQRSAGSDEEQKRVGY